MTRQVTGLKVIEKTVANGNWDTSRKTIDRVIIHTMVGTASSADSRFNNSTQQVSAHYGVLEDGTIWHWVDEDNTAYHAGNYAMNQRSIGIEHEDNGDYNGVRPDALYTASAKLVRDICQFYNIPIDRQHILKHSEVIATGCPDALDIERIVREAQGTVEAMATITQKELDQIRHDRDQNYNDLQAEKQNTTKLTEDLKKEQEHSKTLLDELQKESEKNLDTTNQLLDAQKALKPLQDEILGAKKVLGIKDTADLITAIKVLKASKIKTIPKPKTFAEKLKFLLS